MSQKTVTVFAPDGTQTVNKVKDEVGSGADLIKKMGFLDDDAYQIRMKSTDAKDQMLGDVLTAEALQNMEIQEGDQIVVFPRVIGG